MNKYYWNEINHVQRVIDLRSTCNVLYIVHIPSCLSSSVYIGCMAPTLFCTRVFRLPVKSFRIHRVIDRRKGSGWAMDMFWLSPFWSQPRISSYRRRFKLRGVCSKPESKLTSYFRPITYKIAKVWCSFL